jgi:membrane protein DedA with SNARE-associated domain
MERLVSWVQGFALALGGPGLFLIAVLDSSFLSFPEVVDLLIVVYVTHHKERMVYYATLATLGSIAGCFLLYWVGRRGGERFLRKKLHEQHVDRALAMFQKHGLLAVIIAGVRTLDFLLAVALGRGVRYFGEGLLAVWYGERAADFIRHNASTVSLVLAIAALVFGAGWMWYKSRRARLS